MQQTSSFQFFAEAEPQKMDYGVSYELRKRRVVVNTVTDTGAMFEVGNILIALQESLIAAGPSALVGLMAASARMTGEFKRAGLRSPLISEISTALKASAYTNNVVTNNKVTRWVGGKVSSLFNKIIENPNVGLEVSAIGLATSSVIIPIQALMTGNIETLDTLYHWGQEETIIGTFALANMCNGSAARFDTSLAQNSMKSVGATLVTTGLMMMNSKPEDIVNMITFSSEALSDPFLVPSAILAGGTVQSIWQGVKGAQASGLLQPQVLLGAGSLASAAAHLTQCNFAEALESYNSFMNSNMPEAISIGISGFALLSLDAVFKSGGAHQKYFEKSFASQPV